ncbi:energy transducer TonB [Thiothrix subterranea]|uniref:Protein TonB n=2 Tax=Thiothrix subterranea TaxID=2735563 RepID=A0AA51MLU0_9GAMM|nr:energy transducer TonB [Thiothrix subterranea]MDQ5769282.1 energy transducer TonB [Thiothrix subterranea]WML86265.1 energy transducer TonB [Thiothrix subterranea]
MKTNHISGFGISTAVHIGLALFLMPLLFAAETKPEEPPILPVELSMFAPKAPEPAPEPVPQVAPKPPTLSPPPLPQSKPKPKEKPKPEKPKPEKKMEKPLPKPKPEKDLRQEQEQRERREAERREREKQQQREVAERQARQRAQQETAARAAAQAQNAVPVITNPRYRRPPSPPDYPRRALESGTEGTVIVRANVNPSGSVIAARVQKSSGNASLDAAALKAVRGWAFVPATRSGQNIESIVQVPVNFRIR